ncbi:acyl carrier protein [Saccharopolyspora lacisalsi]|uniref:Acyl carrier protein n=1 Tax=Halosaccharopolyspora lacisalsi TaxID=1000566 RepID=A0A839E385_9PSEU|nr:phosphopantetheine-binding protein [Halosaccharopolyspora lacisalsi]MBA8826225.1 acyl carrier protein [Halosaccharopolyspora lacisalsi]
MSTLHDRVMTVMSDKFSIPQDKIEPDLTMEDLSFDSLILIEFGLVLSKEFDVDIADDEISTEFTVSDVVDLVTRKGARP